MAAILRVKQADGTWAEIPALVGPKGSPGDTGNGIASAVLNADYTLTLTFTDGTSYTTPSIRGAMGEVGEETDPTVPAWAKSSAKPTYTAAEVGADPTGTAAGAVSTHNTDTSAHSDLRDLISGLSDRLNALADSDDTTLDQLSEIVAYIKTNKDLIDGITTSKVSVSDIVDNLTTNTATKPLSAAQGVALKKLIDAIVVPSKVSELTNDAGYLTSYTETDPTVPSWAKAASKPTYTKTEVGLGNVDNVKQYSASNPPPYPVTSVQGQTGAVTLPTITLVGTDEDGTEHTWTLYGEAVS